VIPGWRRLQALWQASPVKAAWHLAVAAAVAFVSFWRVGVPDASGDEGIYLHCGYQYVSGHLTQVVAGATVPCNFEHPPLAKEILGLGLHLFGNTLTVGRSVTALFGIGTALFLYLVVRDLVGWRGGLVAATLWGLTPQAGVENGVTTHALRISRFAILDPYLCFFFALALLAGWRLRHRGTLPWALTLGVATAGAALSKEVGIMIAPLVIVAALSHRWRRDGVGPTMRLAGGVLLGGVATAVLAYLPFGWSGAWSEIHFMWTFQLAHTHSGTPGILRGHYYVFMPWWADVWYAITGMGWWFAGLLTIGVLAGLAHRHAAVWYALLPSLALYLVTAASRLTYPFYWIDVEPGLVVVAAVGIMALLERGATKIRSAVFGAVALVVIGGLASSLATVQSGPYLRVAQQIHCTEGCVVDYVSFVNVLENYVSGTAQLARPGHGSDVFYSIGSPVVVSSTHAPAPNWIVIDPSSPIAQFEFKSAVDYFEANARRLGYEAVPTSTRLLLWRHRR